MTAARQFVLVDFACPFRLATATSVIAVAALWNQFGGKAQLPLNLLSYLLGQTYLCGCPDARGHSYPGRNLSSDEAGSLARVQIKRFPNDMTL